MTVTEESRRETLERYGRFYGEQRFAVAFTSTTEGEEAKRVTTQGWDTTRPLADGDYGASYVAGRGEKRNPAIVLRPSNLIVLECDTEEDLLAIEALGLPRTLTVRSSKPYKRHFYYRPDERLEQLPYVAFRFESGKLTADSGRYFLAPPSLHPSGAVYAFLPGLGPDDVEIATLERDTYTQLADRAREETATQRAHLQVDPQAKIRAGNRRDTIFRAACQMRRWTANKGVVLESMLTYNAAMCDPPLSAEQVEMQVDGAMKMKGGQDLQRALDAPPLPDEPELREYDEPPDLWDDHREAPGEPDPTPAPEGLIRVVTLDDFIAVEEDMAEPLLGTPEDALLDATGMLLMYGDGGAGKTTLSIDALAHLASGTEWLGIPIPRPIRVLLIENEGPRMPFRRKLAAKAAAWAGAAWRPNVTVMEDPWTHFTLSDPEYRAALAHEIHRTDSDLLMVGPLASIGAKGTGTPDDVNEFDSYIGDLRRRCARPFAPWIIHHENKAGDVSGAWERLPDSLVHVTAQGNGRTRVTWRKVRWSSTLHGTSTNLVWAEAAGFTVEDAKARDIHTELVEAFRQDNQWRTYKEAGKLAKVNVDKAKVALGELVERGEMEFMEGPPGRQRNAQCWRLHSDSKALSPSESEWSLGAPAGETDSRTPPVKESESESVAPGDAEQTQIGLSPTEDDLPF